jgi:predicted 2-oxoglutarate/Fe(II)-dependent dioxygenase YbiX
MKTGSFNPYHTDNYTINDNSEVVINPEFAFDKSAILYLNENYLGGELFFPNQNLLVKPETGDLIFFEGDLDKPHEVKMVTSGERHAFITFYEPEGYLADNGNIS